MRHLSFQRRLESRISTVELIGVKHNKMNNNPIPKKAFTLIEMLVVIAVIVTLLSIMATVGKNVFTKAKTNNTQATIKTLVAILEEYQTEKGGDFPFPPIDETENEILDSFDDGNPNTGPEALPDSQPAFDVVGNNNDFDASWDDADDFTTDNKTIAEHEADRKEARASIEFIYQVLDEVKACSQKLKRLPESVVVNSDGDSIFLYDQTKPLYEIIDAWNHPLLYEATAGNFPKITSAGPDGMFDTADDIISTEF